MPSREFNLRLQDMLTEIAVVEKTIAGLTYETFSKNEQALRVILYSLAVIGEAVASSTDALEAANPELPWYQIRGMRNMVIYESGSSKPSASPAPAPSSPSPSSKTNPSSPSSASPFPSSSGFLKASGNTSSAASTPASSQSKLSFNKTAVSNAPLSTPAGAVPSNATPSQSVKATSGTVCSILASSSATF